MDLSIPKDEDKHANRDKVATIFEGAVDWEPFIPKREAQKRGFGLAGEILCVHLWSGTCGLSLALSKSSQVPLTCPQLGEDYNLAY